MAAPAALRAGIIGYGLAGRYFHAPLIEATPGLEVGWVVSADPERSAAVARELPGAEVCSSTEELWRRKPDLVVVAAASGAHAELAGAAVDAGLPVVVDKPLAADAAGARALIERARDAGVPLTVFQNRRWDADTLTVREQQSELGAVWRFESRLERWRPEPRPQAWRDTVSAREGGGVLLDLGTHLVDQAMTLFGPVTGVHAELFARRGGPAEDDAFLALTHESGTVSHLWASLLAAAPGPRLRVLGERGGLVVAVVDGQEDALRSGRRPDRDPDWGAGPPAQLHRGEEVIEVAAARGQWQRFYAGVERALRGEGPLPVDPQDALAALEVIDRARAQTA